MDSGRYRAEQIFPTAAEVAEWKGERRQGVLRVRGMCPHCHEECVVEVHDRLLWGGRTASLGADRPPEAIPRELPCNCEGRHEKGRPDDVIAGCGRFWMGMIRSREEGGYLVEPFTDRALFPALRHLSTDERTEDDRIGAAAEKWLGAVTALCGLFTLAGVATAKDALAGVGTLDRISVAIVFLGALAAAAGALITGYTAAYPWPTEIETGTAEDVVAYERRRREAPRVAARKLRQAVILAGVSLGLLSAVMLLLWFLPRASTATTTPPRGPAASAVFAAW